MKLIVIVVTTLIAAVLAPTCCFGQAVLIAHTAVQSSAKGTAKTNPIDTSSCTTHCMEVMEVVYAANGSIRTLGDSNDNNWQEVPGMQACVHGYQCSEVLACYDCSVSTHQTFSASQTAALSAGMMLAVQVWNAVAGLDKGAVLSGTTYSSPPSVGPIASIHRDEIVLTFIGTNINNDTVSIGNPFTTADALGGTTSNSFGVIGSAYSIQTNAGVQSAHWSLRPGSAYQEFLIAFYSTEAPGTLSVTSAALREAFKDYNYNNCLAASGGIQPYTWSQTGGNPLNNYGLSLNASTGCIVGKPNTTVLAAPITFQVKDSNSITAPSSKISLTVATTPLSITTSTCPEGIQLQAYSGCTIAASGGTPPYVFSWDYNPLDNYASLPPGLALDPSTGALTSSLIGAEGTYGVNFVVADAADAQATRAITLGFQGRNAFLKNVFPSDSIFHHRVDAATTGLPVDTSPAAPIYFSYLHAPLGVFFGSGGIGPKQAIPDGIPIIEVPHNQATVPVSTLKWQYYFGTSGGSRDACTGTCAKTAPIPTYAPIEGTCVLGHPLEVNGDAHVLVYQEAEGGSNPALYEMYEAQQQNGQCGAPRGAGWIDYSNAYWPNTNSDALIRGSSDAAGLPVGPLLLNADEVCGTDATVPCSHPDGTIRHPIRFTVRHMLPYWVWPASSDAGVGNCMDRSGQIIRRDQQISQGTTSQNGLPIAASCPSTTGVAGEIYRLKASTANPSCAATSPQAAIIITALRNYGMILADNGLPALIGTPDIRWNDSDLSCIRKLTLADFEPVNVSSMKVSDDSGQTRH